MHAQTPYESLLWEENPLRKGLHACTDTVRESALGEKSLAPPRTRTRVRIAPGFSCPTYGSTDSATPPPFSVVVVVVVVFVVVFVVFFNCGC